MSVLQIIADIPTNAALRLKAKALEDENARLKKRCAELEQELASKTVPAELIQHRGALFKRRPDGGYNDDVLCSSCRHPMVAFGRSHPYACDGCGITVNFTGPELQKIMKELEAM